MPAGYYVQLALLGGYPRYRQRHRRVDVAGEEIDLIPVNQLTGPFDPSCDVVRRISNQQLRLSAKNAAAAVDLLDGEPSASNLTFSKRRIDPGDGLDHSYLYRLFAASANWKRRPNRARGACQAGFKNGAPVNSSCALRRPRCHSPRVSNDPSFRTFHSSLRSIGATRWKLLSSLRQMILLR